ncbi:MAG: group II intron maturase-specific domain-containing protein [Gaiellaceae bacterium]
MLDRRGLRLPRLAHPASTEERTGNYYVYTHPSRRSQAAIRCKVRALTRPTSQPNLRLLLLRLNAALPGWANYFKHGVSKRSFSRLGFFAWRRVVRCCVNATLARTGPPSGDASCTAGRASR